MKSAGRMALRHPPSSNMKYSARLYNVEGLDHNVHEPVSVPRMADMQRELRNGRLRFQLPLNKSIKVNGD